MRSKRELIVTALLEPERLQQFSMSEWDLLIRQGRATNLLARLAFELTKAERINSVPQQPRLHLNSALQVAQRQDIAVRWEVECIRQALRNLGDKIVLLKGAAYVLAGLSVAKGRTFSDVDIIVEKSKLSEAEGELMIHGWKGSHHDEYDQRYYRRWMHEIPPMMHVKRGTTIDVHHTILPETARIKVNIHALLDNVIQLNHEQNLYVLQPPDMLLHSATHLFHEGDFEKGLRDLFDLHILLREFSAIHGFWEALVPRAVALGLTRPLYYALRYLTLILNTPIPDHVLESAKIGKPSFFVSKLMDACYLRALRPLHSSISSFDHWLARFVLYVRSHWIRMPMHLLAYHLVRKAFLRKKPDKTENAKKNAEANGN